MFKIVQWIHLHLEENENLLIWTTKPSLSEFHPAPCSHLAPCFHELSTPQQHSSLPVEQAMVDYNVGSVPCLLEHKPFRDLSLSFPDGSVGKESACNAGDLSSISGSGRSPGEGNGYSRQYSCLENPMDRGSWRATVHGATQSRTRLGE